MTGANGKFIIVVSFTKEGKKEKKMELSKIVNGYDCNVIGNCNTNISSIKIDCKSVEKDDVFVCLVGERHDGNDYVLEAIKNGASVVVTNRKVVYDQVVTVQVEDTRKAYAYFSSAFFDFPSKKLKTVAIVGTNGKTTTSYILKSVLESANKKVGVIGTLGVVVDGEKYESSMTTPDPFYLQKYLSVMVDNSIEYAIIEVSAHAIFYNKIYGIRFNYSIFTNFSQDHLDFFASMANYFMTKLSFFTKDKVEVAVINSDDLLGRILLTGNINLAKNEYHLKDSKNKFYSIKRYFEDDYNISKISYGIENPCDVFLIDLKLGDNISFIVNSFDDIFLVRSSLAGRYNAYNLLGVIALCSVLGIDKKKIVEGIKNVKQIEGRFNIIIRGNKKVVVDFAHTEDGLKNLLTLCRSTCKGRLICLFGAGGNRDKTKREKMGKVASEYADLIVLTSDNPRYENPRKIIADIEKGVSKEYFVVEDRKDAIIFAISKMHDDDLLVIAGKGGETKQEINGIFYDFNDKNIVEKYLR